MSSAMIAVEVVVSGQARRLCDGIVAPPPSTQSRTDCGTVVVVAGGDVDLAAFGVDCRGAAPDSVACVARRGRRDYVRLPEDGSSVEVEDAACCPRNDNSYPGTSAASASSCEATPTYTRPSNTVADWVMIAAPWSSTLVFQTSAPVCLSKASRLAPGPPKPGTKTKPCVPTITKIVGHRRSDTGLVEGRRRSQPECSPST